MSDVCFLADEISNCYFGRSWAGMW